MSRQNVEIVRRFIEVARTDAEAPPPPPEQLEELLTPDIEWLPTRQSLLAGSKYHGYSGFRQFWRNLFSAWDEYRVEPQEFTAVGEHVVVIYRIRARTRGIEIDELWSGLFTLRDGKIARFQGFSNQRGALEAAGLSEQRPRS